MRNPSALATRLAILATVLSAIACSDPAPTSTTDTAATGGDTTTYFDTAADQDASAGSDAKADTAGGDVAVTDSAGTDANKSDAATQDTAAADTAVADAAVADAEVADATVSDTAVADAAVPDSSVADTAAPDSSFADTAAPDTAGNDATAVDAGPAACSPGTLKRCWVECPVAYTAGCINAGLPVLIMGTQACADGQWQPCATDAACSNMGNTCSNGTKLPVTVQCTDGSAKAVGGYLCTKPLGAQCTTSYYGSWPMADCPDLCGGPDDVCNTAGEKRECVATCGSTTGPTVKGTQNCNDYCDGKFWGPCLTDDACLKLGQ
ncbi:MAG: hypothetical protein HY902_18690 [Deltaproteobacteria bacterium]|nr:hypothetical protein [Deltaproteobacteria bacterium]